MKLTPKEFERFWSKVNKDGTLPTDSSLGQCWEWTGAKCAGRYGNTWFTRRPVLAHRLSYMLHIGDPRRQYVCHHCDNGMCVRPSHLFIGDQFDNMRDMVAKGRGVAPIGEKHPLSKLSRSQVIQAFRLKKNGKTGADIARLYGVTRATINKILRGESWKHVGVSA